MLRLTRPVWAPLFSLTWKFLVKVFPGDAREQALTRNFHVKADRGVQTGLGDIKPLFPSLGYSVFALWLDVGDFWIFLSHFFCVFWRLRFGLLLRGRGSFDTLPHASPFSSDTGIPAHVGRLCLPPRWRLRHMLQELRIIIKISSMLSDSWAG